MADPTTPHLLLDPFAITPDPDAYVPRESTELASQKLLASVRNPEKSTALIGPTGLGKSLLLQRIVAEFSGEWETVYLPYAALPATAFGAWVLRLLGAPTADDPATALRAFGKHLHEQESALLIAIDDAGTLPDETARWIGQLLSDAPGALRLLIAGPDDVASSRTIAAIGAPFDVVFLSQPMSQRETAHYIEERLAMARVPDSVRERFDTATLRELHRSAAGVPRDLHAAAAALLRGTSAEPAPVVVEPDPVLESLIDAQLVSPEAAVAPVAPGGEDAALADTVTLPPHPIRRIEAPPSRLRVVSIALVVAAISVLIPLIRSLLPEPESAPPSAAAEQSAGETAERNPAAASDGATAGIPIAAEPAVPAPAAAAAAAAIDPERLGPFPVQINATPWATVRVDGVDLGQTPLANIPLLAGPHTFRVQMADGRVIERVVEIDAKRRFISFD